MELTEFSSLDRNCVDYFRIMIGEKEENLPEVRQLLSESFKSAYENDALIYVDKSGKTTTNPDDAILAVFFSGYENKYGEEIWARFETHRYIQTPKWWGIFFEEKSRLMKRLNPDSFLIGKMFFNVFSDGNDFLRRLGGDAIPEKWQYASYTSGIVNPILKSYLENTLDRLEYEGKLILENNKMIFNTGLISRFYKEIYVICDVDAEADSSFPSFTNPRYCFETDDLFRDNFHEKPLMATFFKEFDEVVFDSNLEIDLQDAHIFIDNKNRVGESLRSIGLLDESMIQMLFEKGVDNARVLARRNYKLVIPQYWRKTRSIQFLMPIYLSKEFTRPNAALVLERRNNRYKGTTVLTLDMAYQNARLIATPDSFWLDPKNI